MSLSRFCRDSWPKNRGINLPFPVQTTRNADIFNYPYFCGLSRSQLTHCTSHNFLTIICSWAMGLFVGLNFFIRPSAFFQGTKKTVRKMRDLFQFCPFRWRVCNYTHFILTRGYAGTKEVQQCVAYLYRVQKEWLTFSSL